MDLQAQQRFNPRVAFNSYELMQCVVDLPFHEIEILMSHLTADVVLILNKIVPGLPYILYLKHQIDNNTFVQPTAASYREFRDAYMSGEIQFAWN